MPFGVSPGKVCHPLSSKYAPPKSVVNDRSEQKKSSTASRSCFPQSPRMRSLVRSQKQSMEAPDLVDRSADEGVSTSGRGVNAPILLECRIEFIAVIIQCQTHQRDCSTILQWPTLCHCLMKLLQLLVRLSQVFLQQDESSGQMGDGGGGKDIPYGIIAAAAAIGAGITGYLALVRKANLQNWHASHKQQLINFLQI